MLDHRQIQQQFYWVSSKSIRISLALLNLRLLFSVSSKSISVFKILQIAFPSQSDPFVRILSSTCQLDAQASVQANFKTVFFKTGLSHITLLPFLPILCIPPDPGPQHIVLSSYNLLPFSGPTVWAEQQERLICTFCRASMKAGDFQQKWWGEPIPNAWDQTITQNGRTSASLYHSLLLKQCQLWGQVAQSFATSWNPAGTGIAQTHQKTCSNGWLFSQGQRFSLYSVWTFLVSSCVCCFSSTWCTSLWRAWFHLLKNLPKRLESCCQVPPNPSLLQVEPAHLPQPLCKG